MTDDDPLDPIRSAVALAAEAIEAAGGEVPQELLSGKSELDQLLAPVIEAERAIAASEARVAEAQAKVENAKYFEEQTAGIDLHRALSTLFGGGHE